VAFWNRITSLIAGGAVARAAADAATPVLEPVRQHAWSKNQLRVLDPGTAAELVAQAIIDLPSAEAEAANNGIGSNRLHALYLLAQTVPSIGELLRQLNRKTITPKQFEHALAKHKIDPDYWRALTDLANEKLDPAQVAAAIHRGLIPDPGLLKGEQPSGPRKVESYPVYPIDALEEAKADGIDHDRLGVLVGLQGLPMGPHEAAQAYFRGIITRGDYIAAFNESNNRNEWAEALLEQTRQIPTARDFFENALRGYHDLAWAQTEAERHGMSHADSLVIYQNQGRPMNVRQITQALARGGVFKPEPGELTDPFEAAIVEGNLKPAYYDLARANRYTLPSAFVMRALTQSGVWTEAKAALRLKESGWIPADADEAAKAWSAGIAAKADPHVTKAQTQLWNTIHASFKAEEIDNATATTALPAAGVDPTAIPDILATWQVERSLIRKQLAPNDLRKAWQQQDVNAATGLPWTRDEALARLLELGYDATDANDYLNIPYKG
jgi:hypothetical protein